MNTGRTLCVVIAAAPLLPVQYPILTSAPTFTSDEKTKKPVVAPCGIRCIVLHGRNPRGILQQPQRQNRWRPEDRRAQHHQKLHQSVVLQRPPALFPGHRRLSRQQAVVGHVFRHPSLRAFVHRPQPRALLPQKLVGRLRIGRSVCRPQPPLSFGTRGELREKQLPPRHRRHEPACKIQQRNMPCRIPRARTGRQCGERIRAGR